MGLILVFVALLPILLGIIAYPVGRKSSTAAHIYTLVALAMQFTLVIVTICLCYGYMMAFTLPGWDISFVLSGVHGLSFRSLYLLVITVMWLVAGVFSPEYFRNDPKAPRYYSFMLITLGGISGMFLAKDLLTLFMFFEVMSLASYVFVANNETEESNKASKSYLTVGIIGGMVALYGLMTLQSHLPSLVISELPTLILESAITKKQLYTAVGCLLFGFGAKAGMFPLHFWLPKSHPVAPAPASALLSGALTKAGIFGALILAFRVVPGDNNIASVILLLGVITMMLGAVKALFSIDIKQVLACSSMSQIGFILVGVAMQMFTDPTWGAETERVASLGIGGAVLHMTNHSIFKLVLFICAGIIYKNCHTLDLNKLRGYGRNKPWLMVVFLIGALGITGVPMFSGYISKSMIHEAIVHYAHHSEMASLFTAVEWAFLISGAMTVAYMTKLFVTLFVEKPEHEPYVERTSYVSWATKILLSIPAVAIIALGSCSKIMDSLATAVTMSAPVTYGIRLLEYPHYLTWECLSGAVISISLGVAIYLGIIRGLLYKKGQHQSKWPQWLDIEEMLYRPLLVLLPNLLGLITRSIALLPRDLITKVTPSENHSEYGKRVKYKIAILIGKILDKLDPQEESHIPAAIEAAKDLSWNNRVVTDGFSFALLMACLGVTVILVYVLLLMIKN